ncbi:hypothetical protein Sjap_026649 [Stephania japonica]|uniref:Uncharacterized protein n=1 Tax=Stephania japonica TaxID=461633 RepID=A0AAP0DYE5_9MAGN
MIKLQPKIYDHIMLTVRISFIPSVCSQVPVIVIRLPEPRGLSVETSTNNRRFLMVFPLLTAALSTPPDIWCQIVARFPISSIIELAISVASIVQVREEGWTSGMRESGSIDKKEETQAKAGARALLYSIKRKEADYIGGANRKAQLCGANQSSVPRGLRWQSQPLPPNIKGPMVRGPRHMTEIQRLGSAPVPFKHRKAQVRSVSPHVDRRANISLSARSCGKCEELSH